MADSTYALECVCSSIYEVRLLSTQIFSQLFEHINAVREHTTELFIRKAVLHNILCWEKPRLLLAGRAKTVWFVFFLLILYVFAIQMFRAAVFVMDICHFARLDRGAQVICKYFCKSYGK